MRIYFFPGNIFLGIILILFGISAILKTYDINIPFFRIILAFVLIYFGVVMLIGKPVFNPADNISLFSNTNIKVTSNIEEEYNIIFSSGVIDMTELEIENVNKPIEVNVIFGSGILEIDKEIPFLIDASSAFGSVNTPGGNNIIFGDYIYQNEVEEMTGKRVVIKASAVFGNLDVKEKE